MEIEVDNEYLACLLEGMKVPGKPRYQPEIIKKFIKTVNILRALPTVEVLFQFNSLHYERLGGDKVGLSSVRLNKQFRLEFREVPDNEGVIHKFIITDLSNHYK